MKHGTTAAQSIVSEGVVLQYQIKEVRCDSILDNNISALHIFGENLDLETKRLACRSIR